MASAIFTTPTPENEQVLSYAPGTPEKQAVKAELKRQTEKTIEIPVKINGKPGKSDETVKVTSPQNHQLVLGHCQQVTEEEVKVSINAALTSRREWANLPWEERAAVFLRAADLIATKYRPVINSATMLGQGKTIHQAEIDSACELIDFLRFNVKFAEQIYAQQPISSRTMWNRSEARGLEGFVFAVTPFNFTAIACNLPTAPALMGCSVVWKPAPTQMLAAHWTMHILEEAGLPPGVINMIPGDPKMVGEVVLNNPDLSGIHFTGSTATFNYLWSEVGKNIGRYRSYPRIVGETGGKDFVFAHNSADIDQLVIALARGAFEYQGQKCSAASRAYIPKSIWPEVKGKLVEMTEEIKMGDPSDFTNFMGAVIDRRAFEKITGFIKHAKESPEAEIIAGGEYDDQVGYFIRPTIIEAKIPRYKSMVEEIFGPVLTIYVYEDRDLDEALSLCDESTPYALTGAIFARDRLVISQLSQRLTHSAGNFYINDKPTGAVVGQQPFGGGRASGTNDKAGSIYNLLRWVSHRTIKETFTPVTDYRYPFMQEP